MPHLIQVLLNLPHPLELLWLAWAILLPSQMRYLLRSARKSTKIQPSGEMLNFREVAAVGCVGGFILLTFIFAYCTSITLRLAGLIE